MIKFRIVYKLKEDEFPRHCVYASDNEHNAVLFLICWVQNTFGVNESEIEILEVENLSEIKER